MSGLSFETETEKENNHKKIFWIAAVFCIMLFISLVIIGISTFSIKKLKAANHVLTVQYEEEKSRHEELDKRFKEQQKVFYRQTVVYVAQLLPIEGNKRKKTILLRTLIKHCNFISETKLNPELQEKLSQYILLNYLLLGDAKTMDFEYPKQENFLKNFFVKCGNCNDGVLKCPDCNDTKICQNCGGSGQYNAERMKFVTGVRKEETIKHDRIVVKYKTAPSIKKTTQKLNCPKECPRCLEPLICQKCKGFGLKIYQERIDYALQSLTKELQLMLRQAYNNPQQAVAEETGMDEADSAGEPQAQYDEISD